MSELKNSRSIAELRHNAAIILEGNPKDIGKVRQKVRRVKHLATGNVNRELEVIGRKIDQYKRVGDHDGVRRVIATLRN